LAIVLGLAAWQIARGLEKTALAAAREERMRQPPLSTVTDATLDFTRLSLTGRMDADRSFLVSSAGGAQVFSPLRTSDGAFLVNRGRIPLPMRSAALPPIATPAGEVTVTGVAWPNAPPTRLAANETWPSGWPKRVRAINIARMAAAVAAHPREIRLEPGSAGVLQAASLTWDYAPGTHWGYAAQWLAIGLAVVAGYVVVGKRRGRQERADG